MTEWQPTVESRDDVVTPAAARALHDLLDRDGDAPGAGDPLPILWHWLAFLPRARQSELGADGHPRTGGFLPPTGGRRRMYAGGSISLTGPIAVGEQLHRESVVKDVTHKSGRTGDLLFVTVDNRIAGARAAIDDRNDIVYKDPTPTVTDRRTDPDVDANVLWARDVTIDPPLLFRISALTYNAHRIHYDREYATKVEGYPGLVVHGPLQAILLADAAARAFPGATVTGFTFRSMAPAFDGHPLRLRVREGTEPHTAQLSAYSAGAKTMTATAVLEETP